MDRVVYENVGGEEESWDEESEVGVGEVLSIWNPLAIIANS